MFLAGYISSFVIAVVLSLFYLSYTVQHIAESFKKKDKANILIVDKDFQLFLKPTSTSYCLTLDQVRSVSNYDVPTQAEQYVPKHIDRHGFKTYSTKLLFPVTLDEFPALSPPVDLYQTCHSSLDAIYSSNEYYFSFFSRPPPTSYS